MNLEKIIRFGFSSPRRRLLVLTLAGVAAVTSLFGIGGKESTKVVTTTTTITSKEVVEDVSYANCAAVKAAGKAPIKRGDPGYGSHLDRDGDGVACVS